MTTETAVWQRDIDSGAVALLTGTTLTADQWQACADRNHGRTRDIYQRCAQITRFRQELGGGASHGLARRIK